MTNYPPRLPLAPHMMGRAAPVPSAPKAPAAQPVPQPKAQAPQVVIPVDDSDDPDVTTVLTDDATAEDIAAAAGRFRRAAQLAADAAERGQDDASGILEAAQAEAEKIIAAAKAKAQPLTDAAAAEAKRAADLTERFGHLRRGAELAVIAENARVAYQAMKDERDELATKHAGLAERRNVLGSERRDLEAQLSTARDAGDLDTMTTIKTRLAAIEDLDSTLQAQQAPLQQRMAELGTGDENFTTHPLLKTLPPLVKARDEASRRRGPVAGALNLAFPDRPEAVAAAERQREAEYARFDREARDREAAARPSGQRRVVVGR